MAISINWETKVIFVPKADMALVQTIPYEVRELDLDVFRLALKDLEDGEEGVIFDDTHRHNTEVLLGGVTYARSVEIINGYTVTFEDDQYAVNLVGANSNVGDVLNLNQVSVRSANSAGLIAVDTGGGGNTSCGILSTPLSYRAITNNQAETNPNSGNFKWDNTTQNIATEIYISTVTDGGTDIATYLAQIPVGTKLYLQDKDNSSIYQRWTITSLTNNVTWYSLGVTLVTSGGGNLSHNTLCTLILSNNVESSSVTEQDKLDIATAVWNQILTAGTHNIANSAGRRLREVGTRMLYEGEIVGTPTLTVFDTNLAQTEDNFYSNQLFIMTSGTLAGQARVIQAYDGTTKQFTFYKPWTSLPISTDRFEIHSEYINSALEITTELDAIQTDLSIIKGLVKHNFKMTDLVYNVGNKMTSAKMKIYPTPLDLQNSTNEIAVYVITAAYNGSGQLIDYKVVPE